MENLMHSKAEIWSSKSQIMQRPNKIAIRMRIREKSAFIRHKFEMRSTGAGLEEGILCLVSKS